jgi:hypothetical protein
VWFDLRYEKLPYYCSHLQSDKPLIHNAEGKLPYDVQLRVHDLKWKKLQSFSDAAAETFGSVSSPSTKQPQGSSNLDGGHRSEWKDTKADKEVDDEVSSPLKKTKNGEKGKDTSDSEIWRRRDPAAVTTTTRGGIQQRRRRR